MEVPPEPLTVLLTRDGGLADEVRALGAEVRLVELTRHEPLEFVADFAAYDWIVFTSARSVRYSGFRPVEGPRIACVGPRTVFAVVETGAMVHLRPGEHNAAALAEELIARADLRESRVLFPCSEQALPTLPDRLAAAGARVTRLPVYRTVTAQELPPGICDGVDVAVFMAPSAVAAFQALGGDPAGVPTLAIGPTTAAALRGAGGAPRVAPCADRAGLLEALTIWERD